MRLSELIEEIFPASERKEIAYKSNVMFVVNNERVSKYFYTTTDTLRATVFPLKAGFVSFRHIEEGLIHVSDLVRTVIYGEPTLVEYFDLERIRIFARGLLFHTIFRKRLGARLRATFEYPITYQVVVDGHPYILVGSIDAIAFTDDNKCFVIEVKSGSSDKTVEYGMLQTAIYWLMLEHQHTSVAGGLVVTPDLVVEVMRPISKRELTVLTKTYVRSLKVPDVLGEIPE